MSDDLGFANCFKPQTEMTATPAKYPQGYFHDKPCRECGEMFSPIAPSHLFCSQPCVDNGFSRRYLKKAYKISLEEYRNMFVEQDYKCAICGSKGFKICQDAKAMLAVDHCHTTRDVRGLLCHNCNRALGLFQDSTYNLASAIRYLESPPFKKKETTDEPVARQSVFLRESLDNDPISSLLH